MRDVRPERPGPTAPDGGSAEHPASLVGRPRPAPPSAAGALAHGLALGAALGWALAAGAGCSEPPPSRAGVGREVPSTRPRPRPQAPSIFDADGVPRESDELVAGLRLPLGLVEVTELRRTRRRSYFSDEVSRDALLRYFGPRLTTVNIDQRGASVTYREAVPRDVRGGVVKLDVTIAPSSAHQARVTIVERLPPPPPGERVSPEEIRAHLDSLNPRNRE